MPDPANDLCVEDIERVQSDIATKSECIGYSHKSQMLVSSYLSLPPARWYPGITLRSLENWKEEKVTLFPRRLFLRLAALALAAVLALGLTACDSLPGDGGHIVKPSTGSSQPFEMHFIDVGQALSVLVECRQKECQ